MFPDTKVAQRATRRGENPKSAPITQDKSLRPKGAGDANGPDFTGGYGCFCELLPGCGVLVYIGHDSPDSAASPCPRVHGRYPSHFGDWDWGQYGHFQRVARRVAEEPAVSSAGAPG